MLLQIAMVRDPEGKVTKSKLLFFQREKTDRKLIMFCFSTSPTQTLKATRASLLAARKGGSGPPQ